MHGFFYAVGKDHWRTDDEVCWCPPIADTIGVIYGSSYEGSNLGDRLVMPNTLGVKYLVEVHCGWKRYDNDDDDDDKVELRLVKYDRDTAKYCGSMWICPEESGSRSYRLHIVCGPGEAVELLSNGGEFDDNESPDVKITQFPDIVEDRE